MDFLLVSKILVGGSLRIVLKKLYKWNRAQLRVAHYFNNRETISQLLSYFKDTQINIILNIGSFMKTKLFKIKTHTVENSTPLRF